MNIYPPRMHSKPTVHCRDSLSVFVIGKSQRIMQQITKHYGHVLPNNSDKINDSYSFSVCVLTSPLINVLLFCLNLVVGMCVLFNILTAPHLLLYW